ncbi:putative cytosolic Fe-S cluster assembly factor, partial [Smittium culicis]
YVCTHCAECTNIFSSGGGSKLCDKYNVDFLGSIPIDPSLALLLDSCSSTSTAAAIADGNQAAANPAAAAVPNLDRASACWFSGQAEQTVRKFMDRVGRVLTVRRLRLAQVRVAAFEVLHRLVIQPRANEHFKHRLGNVCIDLDHPVNDELVDQRAEQVQIVHLARIRVRHVRYVRVLVPALELQVDLRIYRLPRALLFKRRSVRIPANIDQR